MSSILAFQASATLNRKPAPAVRYFLYARKSSEPDDRQVLSIDSQVRELKQQFASFEVVEVIVEAQSAKAPGRPLFEQMLKRIEAGEAQGIIAWHPDRLARNTVDGGRIIYDLDQGKLTDLKFTQYTFENTPEGKWMLGILFGQSKYYVDKLSKDVQRGLRAKLEQGWFPGVAPVGYTNNRHEDKGRRTISKDPERFPLVRRMWELMLSGAYNPYQIAEIASKDWGLRTRQGKRRGGRPLARSAMYRIFTNPFYYGWLEYKGQLYPAKHEPMITEAEFWHVQKLLGQRGRRRPQIKRHFAFTGMIRCGECGGMVTAEEKWKRNKTNDRLRHYIYYRCTKKRRDYRCRQPFIELVDLERQIDDFLATISVSDDFLTWAIGYTQRLHERDSADRRAIYQSLESAHQSVERQIDELLNVRLRRLITDDEYEIKRRTLFNERHRLKEKLADRDHRAERWFELVENTFKLAHTARHRFISGTPEQKRIVLQTLGSNLTLCDKRLKIEPVVPFAYLRSATKKFMWCPG